MHLSFINPHILWLLLLLPLVWAFTLATTEKMQSLWQRLSRRGWASLLIRTFMLIVLILALAGMRIVRTVDDITVAFLVDGSDSVTPAQREWALEFINTALAEAQSDDRATVVVFGKNALVERTPARLAALSQLTSVADGSRTNMEKAIQLGLALLPADTQKRLVVLSDGEHNSGDTLEAARLSAVRDVPIDVVALPSQAGADVVVTALESPDIARAGQTIAMDAHIQSSIATEGQMHVFADGEFVGTQDVQIAQGTTIVPVSVPRVDAGFHRFEVRLEALGDTEAVNNRAAAFTSVEGPPRVLLIASQAERVVPLQKVLEATQAQVDVLSPSQVPADQVQLKRYAAVVLVDVLARDVPRPVIDALPIYVREQGGTLAMIGGHESFGAGGWRRSPVADALPVDLERKDTMRKPDLALVMVIDHSGSMSSMSSSGLTKLDLAKEAVYQSTLGMEEGDQVGVVVFDTMADWVLPVQDLPPLVDVELALSQFFADGGTDIRSGIEPAANALTQVDAKVKHVILLTDGQASSNYADLIDEMRADEITITVVSIGDDANPELNQIAERGGGRYYRVEQLGDVPNIFLSETVMVAGRDIVEGAFIPTVALPGPAVRGLDDMPPLYGYNVTDARPTARVFLMAPDGKPLLAQWQYGLGRGVAWTSDLKGQWAREWVQWQQFPRFGERLLDLLLPLRKTEGLALETRMDQDQAIVDVLLENPDRSQKEVFIEGRVLDPNDEGVPLDFEQVGIAHYRAVVPVDTPGAYLARVAIFEEEGGEVIGTRSSGFVVAYSPEYTTQSVDILPNLSYLTNGRLSPTAVEVFAPAGQRVGVVQEVALPLLWVALLLWPLDIATRRLLLRRQDVGVLWDDMRTRFSARRTQPVAETDETMARLMAARDRARRKK